MFQDDVGNVSLLEAGDLDEVLTFDLPVAGSDETPDKKAPQGMMALPEWIREIDDIYRSNRSHVFVLHGSVNDYPDNSGRAGSVEMTLSTKYDYFRMAQLCAQDGQPVPDNPSKFGKPVPIVCKYSMANGLEFATPDSAKMFLTVLKTEKKFEAWDESRITPMGLFDALALLNAYFQASTKLLNQLAPHRRTLADEKASKSDRTRSRLHLQEHPEAHLTILWTDAKMLFPAGNVASLSGDRAPIAYMEYFAKDGGMAARNKIILITPRLADVQESLRAGDSHVSAIRVRKPDLADRKEWIHNFAAYVANRPPRIGGKLRNEILLPEDLSFETVANMAAGMSRRQMEGIFMQSWLDDKAVDLQMIADHKKKAIESEYGDILDIRQPVGGWSLLGNQDMLIQWANRMVVMPMRLGDRRTMTRGGFILGPPGTGKSWFAECLAGECGVNFVLVDFSKLFAGIVGETEKNVERLYDAIDAMAPCIVCMDELDSAGLSRQSSGDSGVSARVFNRTMQWLSSDARWGKVVALAISNRPDMIDPALMREGRFDQILAALPPGAKNAKGRVAILNALSRKANIVFDVSLKGTLKTADKGLGHLLFDSRIWTGAQIEGLLKRAYSNAVVRRTDTAAAEAKAKKLPPRDTLEYVRQATKTVLVDLQDWDKAFHSYRPGTRDMSLMIRLALQNVNDREYLPEEWQGQYDQIHGESNETATFGESSTASIERD